MVESAIQRALIYWMGTKSFSSKIKIVSNNNEHARHFVNMGVDIGSPDLLLYTRKNELVYLLFLELKKKTGKLSPAQIEWNSDFDENYKSDNCKRAVAYGYNEAIKIIEEWAASI